MTLYEWHLVLDDEFGEPLWGIEERDEMIAAGVLVAVPIEADIAPISGNHCPTCGVIEPHLHVYRWVGEETP